MLSCCFPKDYRKNCDSSTVLSLARFKNRLSHLYVESKKVKLIEAESKIVVTRCWGLGDWKDIGCRTQNFREIRGISSRHLLYIMVTTVDNNVLYT